MKNIVLILIMIVVSAWAKGIHSGEVTESMNSGGYTYMKINENNKSYWIAATEMPISKGDKINFTEEMQMQQFESKTLHRTFDNIMFVSHVEAGAADTSSHKQQNIHVTNALASSLKKSKISPFKTADTLGVAETYQKAKSLAGKKVKIRGKVTKVSHMIMGKNWIHIQDGTGDNKTDDIVFTSVKEDAKAGDIITAEGTVAIDKDFGYGYFYPVIIEESTFTK